MKKIQLTIDRDEIKEMISVSITQMFPGLEIAAIFGLGYGDVTVELVRSGTPDPATAAPLEPPVEAPPAVSHEPDHF